MLRFAWVIALTILFCTPAARGEVVQWVNSSRMTFADAVPSASGSLAALDLGASPPPGSSRLFSRDELHAYAARAHEAIEAISIPEAVRIKRASQRFTAQELDALVRPPLASRLPAGAAIRSLRLPNSLLLVPDLSVSQVQMPRLPKRAGISRLTAVVELTSAGSLIARLPVSMEIEADERATQFALARGSLVNLVIDSGAARISASAALMSPADIGDVVACQVVRTRKVLRARILSSREATVVQQ